jgi:hypothetical protein
MKKLLFLCCFLSITAFAQDNLSVQTSIKDVTVFFQGAEVSRTGSVQIPAGIVTLEMDKLSPRLDERSLQFNSNGDLSVLALNFKVDFESLEAKKKERIATLNKQLKALSAKVEGKRDRLVVSRQEQQLLLENSDYDKLQGISVAQLEQAINFAKTRMISIKEEQQRLRDEIDVLNRKRQEIINKVQEARLANAKPEGKVLVKIKSQRAQRLNLTLSYTIAEAGWRPYYDIKVTDIGQPLKLNYKAKISQSSGEDWKQVTLKLSTGNPAESAQLASLDPWFLNFVNNNWRPYTPPAKPNINKGYTGTFKGLVVDAKSSEALIGVNVVALDANGNLIAGTTTDLTGNFELTVAQAAKRLEFSYIGYTKAAQYLSEQKQFHTVRMSEAAEQLAEVVVQYQPPLIEKSKSATTVSAEEIQRMAVRDVSQTSSPVNGNTRVRGSRSEATTYFIDGVKVRGNVAIPVSISQNPVNLNFDVNLPYDIPSDGEEYQVQVEQYSLDAYYSYTAIPKLNENAFLTAELIDWERLNLLDGDAGLYLEGTYLGETQINVSQAGDTLQLSLGKDENIKVQRKAVKTEEGRSFLKGKRNKRLQYKIAVRNTKAVPLQLTIIDQYPVSGNERIDVERIEHSDAKLDEKTGRLSWEFELQPKESKELDLIYEVSYPKNLRINL